MEMYILFWVALAITLWAVIHTFIEFVFTFAIIIGRNGDVRWDFSINVPICAICISILSFLWHYNFG